jgi:hypothetical protein
MFQMGKFWSILAFTCAAVASMAQSGVTYAISRTATEIANAPTRNVRVSGNGRYVFFDSKATNLISGAGPAQNVYRYDRQTRALELVSFAAAGGAANGDCFLVAVSDNGRYALFSSEASNIIATDNGLHTDVFRTDMNSDTTIRISEVGGIDGNSNSYGLDMDRSGALIVFGTNATNLTTGELGSAVKWEAGNLTTVFSPESPSSWANAAVISNDGTKVVMKKPILIRILRLTSPLGMCTSRT